MPFHLTRRALLSCAYGLFAFSTMSVQAAEEFVVTPAQMQALGVHPLAWKRLQRWISRFNRR